MASPHRHRTAIAWAVSLAFHVEALVLGAGLWSEAEREQRSEAADPPVQIDVDLELPPGGHALAAPLDRVEVEAPASGGRVTPRPDGDRAGRGGEPTVNAPAVNLSPRDDEASLTRTLTSGHDQSQQVRRRSSDRRRSPEDDTIASRPMILTFFADGVGAVPRLSVEQERRLGAPTRPGGADASHGLDGARLGSREPFAPTHQGGSVAASRRAALAGASVPMALEGRTSTPADEQGPQEDHRDGAQEIDAREPSLLAASTAGGEAGAGRGGEEGPGRSGSSGEAGPGSRSSTQGAGHGPGAGLDPGDLYLRRARAKIHASWSASAFPRDAALEGRGGTTIVAYTIAADGSVHDVQTVRPSGFPTFDAAMRQAVHRAAPFGPLPARFGVAVRRTHEFAVVNPPVR
jgi:TonB family protein